MYYFLHGGASTTREWKCSGCKGEGGGRRLRNEEGMTARRGGGRFIPRRLQKDMYMKAKGRIAG